MRLVRQRLLDLAVPVLLGGLLWTGRLWADSGHCDICGALIGDMVYTVQDKVTEEKKLICHDCMTCTTVCFVCGLPVRTGRKDLPDGRSLCTRDARTAMLDVDKSKQICLEVGESLDRLFSRFVTFPKTNVSIRVVDRVNLQTLFKFAGHDYQCPNVWGYLETGTNHGRLEHEMSLLSALPLDAFKATCAHEYTHAWLNEHLPAERKKNLDQDANEGFCELVSYLLMESQNEDAAMKQIKRNDYTRGQIHLFLAAERSYGFNDVVDWVNYGRDNRLRSDDPGMIRAVDFPREPNPARASYAISKAEPTSVPDVLVLKGVLGSRQRPLALINDATFAANEEGKVRVGKTNVLIRCLAIQGDTVRVRVIASGAEMQLRLKKAGP